MAWKPLFQSSACTPVDHLDYIMPFGETIATRFVADGYYNCLNRGDEHPFLITNNGRNGTDLDSKTWTQWLNTPCLNDTEIDPGIYHRRCLGSRPDICIDPKS